MDDDDDDLLECADCGELIDEAEPCYFFGVALDLVLCRECAARRGGAFDPEQGRWAAPPRVDDLGA